MTMIDHQRALFEGPFVSQIRSLTFGILCSIIFLLLGAGFNYFDLLRNA